VLHVDDDADFGALTAEMLEREDGGIEVVTETNADDALEVLGDGEIDCVVSDYEMPGTDGLAFLQEVRAADDRLPFILFTGEGSEDVASEAFSAGATDYLRKEAGTDQFAVLANRVRNYAERFRAQRERQRHLDAIETAREGISILDGDGRFVYVNRAYADIYGYEQAELLGEHWELVYPKEEIRIAREEILPTVEEEGVWRGETTGLRADGTTFPEGHTVASTEAGELICTVRDKTVQKERERELELKQRAMDEALAGITIADPSRPDNPIVYANERFEEITGYERDEVVGRNCRFLQGENTDEEVVATMRDAIDRGEPVTVELRNYRKDGTEFWNEVRISPLEDEHGEVTHLVGFQQDVTGHKERESRIEALHETTRRLMDATDAEEVVRIAVRAAKSVLGLELSGFHAPAKGESVLAPVVSTEGIEELFEDGPPDIDRGDSLAWQVYESGEPMFVPDVREREDVHNPETPVRSEMILPVGEHGVFLTASTEPDAFDDTDEQLAGILASNLEHALDSAQRERELERKNERLNEFTSIVSHDLRNPLNVASLRMDLIAREHDSEHVGAVLDAHDRMESIIEETLALARHGQAALEPEPVSLSEVATGCWGMVSTSDGRLEIADDATIHGDPESLRQLFENLFRNAVEHGSTSPDSQARRDAVEHGSTSPDSQARRDAGSAGSVTIRVGTVDGGIYVEDDGPGIPPEDRSDVLEPGFTTGEDGIGFGLAIVNEIVDSHGWELAVTDGTDGGARFEITGIDVDR